VAEGTTQSIIRASALHWDLLTDHQSLNNGHPHYSEVGPKG
jgi:hypothetical protein